MRILLVEDSSLIRQILARWFSEWGHEYWFEEDPRAWPKAWIPELVLYDLHPFGWGWLDRILEKAPEVRVVMISGDDEPASREKARERGVYEWLVKPFTEDQLREAVGE